MPTHEIIPEKGMARIQSGQMDKKMSVLSAELAVAETERITERSPTIVLHFLLI